MFFPTPALTEKQEKIQRAYGLEAGICYLSKSERKKVLKELSGLEKETGYRSAYLDYFKKEGAKKDG